MQAHKTRELIGLTALVACIAVGTLSDCTSERGLTPVPERYRLYVTTLQENSQVFVFDVSADTLVDSTAEAVFSNTTAVPTPDGKYFFRFHNPVCTELWDAATVRKIMALPGCPPGVLLATRDSLLLAVRRNRIDFISYPSLSPSVGDTLVLPGDPHIGPGLVDESRDVVLCKAIFGGGHTEWVEFLTWNYRNRGIARRWELRDLLATDQLIVIDYTLDTRSGHVFAVAGASPSSVLFSFNLDTPTLRWRVPVAGPFVTIRTTPDGRELWRAPRVPFTPNTVPYIYIHDPATGAVIDTLSLRGRLEDSTVFPGVWDIAFTPDGRKAYATTGDIFNYFYSGPVLVIDVMSRQIVGTLLDGQHYPFGVEIGPAP